ncbi:LysR family transcriptional regulator [Jingyaoa shaoxingensis]|uniref:LysR family transcriptional regulator n=1 Tax=Jingyaoa shaoxingensis TaxID=2763671 RepID=A0ABR7NDE3_9FIRM|nr:LysR family transcriptional regulator [Jingyaoa shaoxingensis]MBC8573852.1 LysR family transcriptional regulator [Jingyaoa shaoxingensis]
MNVNLEYYRIFYYVAKYQNFTRAARAMGNSQPNITRAMNLLEQEIHCTLFIRTNRGVRLTPEGEKLYIRVSAAMEQLQTAEEELHESSGLEHGTISIGASETALNIYLLEKLRTFHMEYPGIRLKIYNHSTPQAVQAVKNGEIDFAVVTTPTDVETPLKKVDLYSFQEILVGGKTFMALGSQELSLAEVQNYPFICLGRETQTWKFYQQIFERHGLELMPDTEVATTDQILPLVKNELGMAFLPEAMAREAIEKGEIIELSLRESVPQRSVCMVYDRQHPLSAAAKELKSRMQQSISTEAGNEL